MGRFFEAIGRLIGAVLALFVLGFILSFLGCGDTSGPWQPPPEPYIPPDPPGLSDPSPPSIYDIPPPPDLQPPPALPEAQPVQPAPVPILPAPLDPGPP